MFHAVRKAVFPVAGLGTRFLPATKASPKEMLPVVDKPLIQYAVEEAVAAGITDLIFITGRNKRAIEDHFDSAPELESALAAAGKQELLSMVRGILPPQARCIYIRQPAALGLGHAVLCAEPVVGREPFAVLLADDLIDAPGEGVTAQLVRAAVERQASVIGVQEIPPEHTRRYGVVKVAGQEGAFSGAYATGTGLDLVGTARSETGLGQSGVELGQELHSAALQRTQRIDGIVEKPAPEHAPSNLGVVGRYVLDGAIFDCLRATQVGAGGEIQLTDGIAALLQQQAVYAHHYSGTRYDCGSKEGFFRATVEIAAKYHGLKA